MKWEDYRMSENVDDRRGDGGYGGGGGTGVGISGGGLGIGTLVVLGLLGWALASIRACSSRARNDGRRTRAVESYSDRSVSRVRRGRPPTTWALRVRSRRDERGRLEGRAAAADGRALASAGSSSCSAACQIRPAARRNRRWAVLLPARQQVYIDTSFFVRCNAISAAAAIRLRLRDRARGRTSHREFARHPAARAAAQQAAAAGRKRTICRARGVDGRLPCGRLGLHATSGQSDGARRRRARDPHGAGHRR